MVAPDPLGGVPRADPPEPDHDHPTGGITMATQPPAASFARVQHPTTGRTQHDHHEHPHHR